METADISSAIINLQVKRKWTIKLANKLKNSTKALARRYCGFVWDVSEAEREKVNKRASNIIDRALAGKEQSEADVPIAAVMEAELELISINLGSVEKRRNAIELEMKKLARQLPVYAWAKDVSGLGEIGLAVIVGEAGDLSKYPNIRHLWKRLGLAPYQGRAMSNWHGNELTAEEWTQCGYSCRRRAEIYACVSDSLFRHQTVSAGPYRKLYDARRAHCEAEHPEWCFTKDGKALKGEGKGHFHDDAVRIMTKECIKDLWVVWCREARVTLPADRWAA